jgi:hypothetical protein
MLLTLALFSIMIVIVVSYKKFKYKIYKYLSLAFCLFSSVFIIIFIFSTKYPNFFTHNVWEKYLCKDPKGIIYNFKKTRIHKATNEIPNFVFCHSKYKNKIKLNSLGYKDFEHFSKNPVDTKNLLIGDNFTFGLGLETKSTIGGHLASLSKNSTLDLSQPGMSPKLFSNLITQLNYKNITPNIENIVYIFRDSHFSRDAGNGKWKAIKDKYEVRNTDHFKSITQTSFLSPFYQVVSFCNQLWNYLKPLNPTAEQILISAQHINNVLRLCEVGFCTKIFIAFWPTANIDEDRRKIELIRNLDKKIVLIELNKLKFSYIDSDEHIDESTSSQVAQTIYSAINISSK